MASKDPYYLVRDDIQASVRAIVAWGIHRCHNDMLHLLQYTPTTQLDKVQSIFATWQGMSKNTAQATNLMHDIEEECSSIQWQVLMEGATRGSAERPEGTHTAHTTHTGG